MYLEIYVFLSNSVVNPIEPTDLTSNKHWNNICISRLTVVSQVQSTPPSKKCDHYCESFTWWNSFAILCHVLKSTWRDLGFIKGFTPSYHLHKTFVLVVYVLWSFRPVCAIACWSIWRCPRTNEFCKNLISFSFFLLVITTHLRAILPP